MNRKQLVILLVLVLVVGGAGLLLRKRQDASWQEGNPTLGKKLLGNLAVNDILRISLKQGTNELNLEKKDDLWRVRERDGYPANFSEITAFILKARDLKIVQIEPVGPSQLPKLGLVAGAGTNAALAIEFLGQGNKSLQTLLLGKKHMKKSDRPSPMGDMGEEGWPDGRYVKLGSDTANVLLIADSLANIEPKPEQWLNKDFFKVEKVRSVAVNFPAATNSWKISRETETGDWKLADAKPEENLDSGKASGVANPLGSPAFSDIVPGANPATLENPTVATLETFDDFTYVLKVGPKTNENYSLTVAVNAQPPKERAPGKDEKPEDKTKLDKEFKDKQTKLEEKLAQEKGLEKWTYVVSGWTLDSLLKERNQLLVEKKVEPPKVDPKLDEKPADPAANILQPPPPVADPK